MLEPNSIQSPEYLTFLFYFYFYYVIISSCLSDQVKIKSEFPTPMGTLTWLFDFSFLLSSEFHIHHSLVVCVSSLPEGSELASCSSCAVN